MTIGEQDMSHETDSFNRVAEQIIEWGNENRRDFPWRSPETPYESALAEILLIRTPPEQVLPVYDRFLERYPGVEALANATQEDIQSLIESLGLRWRSERLHAMARYVVDECGGTFPSTFEGLQDVPGLGHYSASAVMLFYYHRRAFLVDSNSVRFIERYLGCQFAGEARRSKDLMTLMDALTPSENEAAVRFAGGFLDFMREVCRPSQPLCHECVVRRDCQHGQKEL